MEEPTARNARRNGIENENLANVLEGVWPLLSIAIKG